MSHVVSIEVEIQDLAALKAAVKELGCEWREGQKTYVWYGRSVGSAPLPAGFTVDELGKCSHAISVPGESYEVGVVRKDNKWRLLFDAYNSAWYRTTEADKYSNGIVKKFGEKLGKLLQMYGVYKVALAARSRGLSTNRLVMPNGSIKITIGGRL